ncbi:MAG: FAD-dependent protein [Bacteroidota bacterium]
MKQLIELKLKPSEANDEALIQKRVRKRCRIAPAKALHTRVVRRSIDARGQQPLILLRLEVYVDEAPSAEPALLAALQPVHEAPEVLIVGAGPAGYFAALELIEQGLRPILFDRGRDVRARRRDLRAIQQFGEVNPHSNYCFGEGGAGTYSDGKLYTRSHKRGNIYKALRLLVEHGAQPEILIDAHPHIGSNKLPKVVANIRETILHYGGAIHFDAHVTDILTRKGRVAGLQIHGDQIYEGQTLVLATGHSARDIYALLHRKGLRLEAKPFALGVRVEHNQALIDKIQYRQSPREAALPASSYRLACQIGQHGVFSFCMCPGGLVVPAATAPGEIVVNGMSLSRRDSPYANSGTVVSVALEDLVDYRQHGVFAALEFQKAVERRLFGAGDGSQQAPALRMTDFVEGRLSKDLPDSSYIPGLYPAPLYELLPPLIYEKLRAGMQEFGRRMRGYFTAEANVIGTESRTSSPVKIPRSDQTCMHQDLEGLFPCGEGAGYAGGIISAAMDGQRVARAVAQYLAD